MVAENKVYKVVGVQRTPLHQRAMPNISKQLSNLDRYTRYEADELKKGDIKFSFVKWILGPVYIFMRKYFL